VNIGNPVEWTILECAREVLAVTGSESKLVFKDLPVDDPTRRRPDITKAKTLLGWEPKVALREGLELSVGYFRECVERQGVKV
jgi:dTDP-glucose 4,6-dehydratase